MPGHDDEAAVIASLRGAQATKQSTLLGGHGLLRRACHRARIRATRWLAMTGATPSRLDLAIVEPRSDAGSKSAHPAEKFFIIFVDAIFTTLFEWLFTNVLDVSAPISAISCLYPARTTG
jgi:hypothetical protein